MAPAEDPCCATECDPSPQLSDSELNSALARYARALGHPARVAILRHLIKVGACVCGDIVNELPLAQSTVSQHLKQLKDAGLIQGEIDGPRVCYCVRPEAIKDLHHCLKVILSPAR